LKTFRVTPGRKKKKKRQVPSTIQLLSKKGLLQISKERPKNKTLKAKNERSRSAKSIRKNTVVVESEDFCRSLDVKKNPLPEARGEMGNLKTRLEGPRSPSELRKAYHGNYMPKEGRFSGVVQCGKGKRKPEKGMGSAAIFKSR